MNSVHLIFTLGIIGGVLFVLSPFIMIIAQAIASRKGK